jgi:exodeoxyribonuclease VII large subunit
LERGFALVTDRAGHAVGSARDTEPGMELTVRFHDGSVAATVEEEPGKAARSRPAPKTPRPAGQGRLF